MAFLSPKIIFALANSVDPYELMHYAAFHNGLHCLSKYTFWSHQYQRIKPKYGDMDSYFIYDKYSEISNTFLFLFSNAGYQGRNSQNACQNSKQGRP